jgi:hypothetical protein
LTFLALAKAPFLNNLSSRLFLVKDKDRDKVALVAAFVRIFLIHHHHLHHHLLMLILEDTRLPLVYLLRFIHPLPHRLQLQNNGKLNVDAVGEVLVEEVVVVVVEEEWMMKVISMIMMIMMMKKEE